MSKYFSTSIPNPTNYVPQQSSESGRHGKHMDVSNMLAINENEIGPNSTSPAEKVLLFTDKDSYSECCLDTYVTNGDQNKQNTTLQLRFGGNEGSLVVCKSHTADPGNDKVFEIHGSGNVEVSGNINMNSNKLTNVADGVLSSDGVNLGQVIDLDFTNVKLTGDQSIAGHKTFTDILTTFNNVEVAGTISSIGNLGVSAFGTLNVSSNDNMTLSTANTKNISISPGAGGITNVTSDINAQSKTITCGPVSCSNITCGSINAGNNTLTCGTISCDNITDTSGSLDFKATDGVFNLAHTNGASATTVNLSGSSTNINSSNNLVIATLNSGQNITLNPGGDIYLTKDIKNNSGPLVLKPTSGKTIIDSATLTELNLKGTSGKINSTGDLLITNEGVSNTITITPTNNSTTITGAVNVGSIVSSGNISAPSITTAAGGLSITPASAATSITGSLTVSTDLNAVNANAVLGGCTIKNSNVSLESATPSITATNAAANVDISIVPKGTGKLKITGGSGGFDISNLPITSGAITSSGALALGSNTITCGAITSTGALALGSNTITSGNITCGSITGSGDTNIGSNTLTCGSVTASNSITINSGNGQLNATTINTSGNEVKTFSAYGILSANTPLSTKIISLNASTGTISHNDEMTLSTTGNKDIEIMPSSNNTNITGNLSVTSNVITNSMTSAENGITIAPFNSTINLTGTTNVSAGLNISSATPTITATTANPDADITLVPKGTGKLKVTVGGIDNGILPLKCGVIDCSSNKITNVSIPTVGTDAATKTYVDTADNLKLNLAGGTMSGSISLGGVARITNSLEPSDAQDAATKNYVDNNFVNVANTQDINGSKNFKNSSALKVYTDANNNTSFTNNGNGSLTIRANGQTGNTNYGNNPYLQLSYANSDMACKIFDTEGQCLKLFSNYGNTEKTYFTHHANGLAIQSYCATGTPVITLNSIPLTAIAPTSAYHLCNKTYVDTANNLKLNLAGGTMSGNISLGSVARITNSLDPSAAQDAATKNYVDTAANLKLNLSGGSLSGNLIVGASNDSNKLIHGQGLYLSLRKNNSFGTGNETHLKLGYNSSDFAEITSVYEGYFLKPLKIQASEINLASTCKIINLLNPVGDQDAATKNYVDTANNLKLNLAGGTMSGSISLGGVARITNSLEPSAAQDAATKNYVDTAANLKLNLSGGTVSGNTTFSSVTDSTAYTNGAIVCSGGVGIAKALNVNGIFTAPTANITHNIAGTLTVNGGFSAVNANSTFWGTIIKDAGISLIGPTGIISSNNSITMSTSNTNQNITISPSGTGVLTVTKSMAMNSNKITNVADCTNLQDAATKNYVDTSNNLKLNLAGGTMTGNLITNSSSTITVNNINLSTPTTGPIVVEGGVCIKQNLYVNGPMVSKAGVVNLSSGQWVNMFVPDFNCTYQVYASSDGQGVNGNGIIMGAVIYVNAAMVVVTTSSNMNFRDYTYNTQKVLQCSFANDTGGNFYDIYWSAICILRPYLY